MEIYPSEQAFLALLCAALGAAVGAASDVLMGALAPCGKRLRAVLVFLCDLLVVSCAFAGVLVLDFYFDKGRARPLWMLCTLLGYAVYRCTLAHVLRPLVASIVRLVARLARILCIPFIRLFKKIAKILKKCKYYIVKALEKIQFLLYNIYNTIKILKWAECGFVSKHSDTKKEK